MPHGRLLAWLRENDARWLGYTRALEAGGRAEVDEAKSIADAADDPKLQVDVRFRRAKAHAPDVYGERLRVEKSVTVGVDAGLLGRAGALLRAMSERDVTPALADSDDGLI